MTVQVYLSGWRETTRLGRRTFIPEAAVEGESFAVVDLRPDKTVVDGLCLFARIDDGSGNVRPSVRPGRAALVPVGAALRGDKGDSLGPVARRTLGNKLGMDLSTIADMKAFIGEIVHAGPRAGKINGGRAICVPTLANRLETWLGGELVHDIPAIAGGAFTEPFTYSDSDLSTHSPWGDVYGTAKVVSNKCQPNFAGSFDVAWYGTAVASADMYCQASFDTLNGDSGQYNFLAVRIRCDSTAADTGIQWEAGWATSASINQFNMIVFTAGSNSVVGSWGSSDQVTGDVMPARPFTAKIQGNGSSLSGYMGAAGPFNVTDSSHSTKTRSGLMVYSEGYVSSANPRVKIDNWEAGTLATNATATPSTVAAVAAVPAPTVKATGKATPATVAAVAGVGSPTISLPKTITPGTVAAVASVGSPTISLPRTITPSTVAAVAGVGAPTVTASSTIPGATVAAVASVPTPTITATGTVTPSTVAAVAAVGAPTISLPKTITASTVAAVAGVGSPTITASSTITPSSVAAVAAVGAPTISLPKTITPSTVAAVAGVGSPTLTTSATIPASTVAAVADVPAPAIQAGNATTIAPSTVAAVASVGSATITATGTIPASTVAAVASVPTPTIKASATLTPATVAATAAVGAPVLTASGTISVVTVAAVATVGTPTITAAPMIAPATVGAVAGVGVPVLSIPQIIPASTVAAVAAIGTTFVFSGSSPVLRGPLTTRAGLSGRKVTVGGVTGSRSSVGALTGTGSTGG